MLCISLIGNAVYYGNIFHLITFSIMLVFVVVIFIKNKQAADTPKKDIYTTMAVLFIVLGIWYPEFTHVNIVLSLLFAPLGIVPCPTLLTIGGILNLYPGKVNKGLFIYTIILIIVYGVIGTFVFKVYYDFLLLLLATFSILNLRRICLKRWASKVRSLLVWRIVKLCLDL